MSRQGANFFLRILLSTMIVVQPVLAAEPGKLHVPTLDPGITNRWSLPEVPVDPRRYGPRPIREVLKLLLSPTEAKRLPIRSTNRVDWRRFQHTLARKQAILERLKSNSEEIQYMRLGEVVISTLVDEYSARGTHPSKDELEQIAGFAQTVVTQLRKSPDGITVDQTFEKFLLSLGIGTGGASVNVGRFLRALKAYKEDGSLKMLLAKAKHPEITNKSTLQKYASESPKGSTDLIQRAAEEARAGHPELLQALDAFATANFANFSYLKERSSLERQYAEQFENLDNGENHKKLDALARHTDQRFNTVDLHLEQNHVDARLRAMAGTNAELNRLIDLSAMNGRKWREALTLAAQTGTAKDKDKANALQEQYLNSVKQAENAVSAHQTKIDDWTRRRQTLQDLNELDRSIQGLSGLVARVDPKAAKVLSTSSKLATGIASAIISAASNPLLAASQIAGVFNSVLGSIFGGPSDTEVILDAIHQIRKDLVDMENRIHSALGKMENRIHNRLTENFHALKTSLEGLHTAVAHVKQMLKDHKLDADSQRAALRATLRQLSEERRASENEDDTHQLIADLMDALPGRSGTPKWLSNPPDIATYRKYLAKFYRCALNASSKTPSNQWAFLATPEGRLSLNNLDPEHWPTLTATIKEMVGGQLPMDRLTYMVPALSALQVRHSDNVQGDAIRWAVCTDAYLQLSNLKHPELRRAYLTDEWAPLTLLYLKRKLA